MLEYLRGDIFSSKAEALVNPVNCVGVMGKGLALAFKQRFPSNYQYYRKTCNDGGLKLGQVLTYVRTSPDLPKYLINFPTKGHFRSSSRLQDIESGLVALAAEVSGRQIGSLAVPALGCGLGGLDWAQVRPQIEAYLAPLSDCQIWVFEPGV